MDLLRFLAALAVVFAHWANPEVSGAGGPPLTYTFHAARYGFLGVELFFMISGLVILMNADGATLQTFVAARVVRLYPAFWICCTITAAFALLEPVTPTSAAYIASMFAATRRGAHYTSNSLDPVVIATCITVFYALMLAIATRWLQLPSLRFIAMLGSISYPLYLLHHRIGQQTIWLLGDAISGALLFWGMLAWMLLMSWAVHVWVERPLQCWLRCRTALI